MSPSKPTSSMTSSISPRIRATSERPMLCISSGVMSVVVKCLANIAYTALPPGRVPIPGRARVLGRYSSSMKRLNSAYAGVSWSAMMTRADDLSSAADSGLIDAGMFSKTPQNGLSSGLSTMSASSWLGTRSMIMRACVRSRSTPAFNKAWYCSSCVGRFARRASQST